MKLAVYDLETKKGIPSPETNNIMEVCGGWSDFEGMGISIFSITYFRRIDKETTETVTETFLNLADFKARILELKGKGYKIGGFNTKKFDDKLLKAHGFDFTSDFDILDLVRQAAGVKQFQKGVSYSLDFIAKANGMKKPHSGALAPLLFQQGKIKELTDYVMNDTQMEYNVLMMLIAGTLIDPNTGRRLKI